MLPTEDSLWVAGELGRRFGVARWLFTLSATDANRAALRIARQITGRPKVLVFRYCYHGSVDETFAVRDPGGATVSREGNVGPPVDPAATTVAVEFNDLDAVQKALAEGTVACVLAEPAMTNMGIILPDPGYHQALRELTRAAGALLIIDETHTLSAGPGGCTAAWGLDPDLVTLGKAIGSGVAVRGAGHQRRGGGPDAGPGRCGLRGHRRHRRHAGGQRAVDGRDAGHAWGTVLTTGGLARCPAGHQVTARRRGCAAQHGLGWHVTRWAAGPSTASSRGRRGTAPRPTRLPIPGWSVISTCMR